VGNYSGGSRAELSLKSDTGGLCLMISAVSYAFGRHGCGGPGCSDGPITTLAGQKAGRYGFEAPFGGGMGWGCMASGGYHVPPAMPGGAVSVLNSAPK
jgi:hypothetical protein